ncbi:LptF/LptG family permease, partial [Klebsiella pneumoniae]|uniref:LptF/LptG family permease n=1 Tax=Klebsiella pneumoniae TaxID=573 RepID=UPI0015C44DEF
LILLMIEIIFMTEKLNDVLGLAASQNVDTKGIALLLLYRIPEIFNLALPMALLAAAYRVTLRFREERELLALSGIGVGSYRLLLLVCEVGVVAL